MKRRHLFNTCICGLIFFGGFFLSYFSSECYTPKPVDDSLNRQWGIVFIQIIKNNLLVGFLLSIGGLVSGGLSTISVLFWNGFMIGRFFNVPIVFLPIIFDHFIYHGLAELLGFFLFGAIGLKGIGVYYHLIKNGIIEKNKIPEYKDFVLPFLLLILAGIIETTLIVA